MWLAVCLTASLIWHCRTVKSQPITADISKTSPVASNEMTS